MNDFGRPHVVLAICTSHANVARLEEVLLNLLLGAPTMNTDKSSQRTEYLTRDSILKLLSDDEVASVSTAETASRLSEGDEYLDLEHLDHGVRLATGMRAPTAHLLAKKAVRAATWTQIISQLVTPLA